MTTKTSKQTVDNEAKCCHYCNSIVEETSQDIELKLKIKFPCYKCPECSHEYMDERHEQILEKKIKTVLELPPSMKGEIIW